jgi:SP family galactose:H+ symporter-like MFS transporter
LLTPKFPLVKRISAAPMDPLLESPPKKAKITKNMWATVLTITSQSFAFGYTFACLNPCLVVGNDNNSSNCYSGKDTSCPAGSIYVDRDLSSFDVSLATALMVIGAWFGSLFGNIPSDKYGRRSTLFANTVFFFLGAGLSTTTNYTAFSFGRFFCGIGIGVISSLVPTFLSEISDEENRGLFTTMHQLLLTTGILLASLLAFGFVQNLNHGWVYIMAFEAMPGVILLLFYSQVLESPKWLITHGFKQDALNVLIALRPSGYDCDAEIAAISEQASQNTELPSWSEVFKYRKAVIIGCGLMFFQALTGINSVIFYSTTIFGYAGFNQTILATASVGIVNVVMTLVATNIIDRVGRKILLLSGQYIMMFSLFLLSIILYVNVSNTSAQGTVAVVAVLLFIVGFAISLGKLDDVSPHNKLFSLNLLCAN